MRALAFCALLGTSLAVSAADATPAKKPQGAPAATARKAYPSFEMRGRRIGDPEPPEEAPSYNAYGARTYASSDDTIGDVRLHGKIDFKYDETGLISVMGLFRSRDVDRLRSIFVAKYGAPAKTDYLPMTNGYGARLQSRIDNWRFKEGTLMLFEQGTTPGDGFFTFSNPAAEAREEAKNRVRDARAADTL